MEIRRYSPEDLEIVIQLFCNTVQSVNRQHYSAEQIAVWSQSALHESWDRRLREGKTYVVLSKDTVIAFGVLNNKGWLDMLYTDRDHQKKGAGSAIIRQLETEAKAQGLRELWTEASITAKPFFLSQGYEVVREQQKLLSGTAFINYLMRKRL